jgi:hypothetical protein
MKLAFQIILLLFLQCLHVKLVTLLGEGFITGGSEIQQAAFKTTSHPVADLSGWSVTEVSVLGRTG